VAALMVAGALAEAFGWRLVATGRASVWRLMPPVLGLMGIAAVLGRPPVASARVSGLAALGVGAASGVLLYGGARAFVAVVSRVKVFGRHVGDAYRQAAEVSPALSLGLSLAVLVPAEELFWRGLFQARLDQSLPALVAGAWTWIAYLGVNAASANLPIVSAAVVGGALWAGLAAWSGGMLASLTSHMLWTGLMLAFPPGAGRGVRAR